MNKNNTLKIILLILYFVIIGVPYAIFPSEDLYSPVCHDEAAHHLNAKQIVQFGFAGLQNERPLFILFPLHTILGIISFSLFGFSLFSLRLPYILFSLLGNALFFDLIKKTRGILPAAIITAAFALYPPRLMIGKSAMAESLALSLMLILLWCLMRATENKRIYFWIGILSACITMTKIDNVFVLLFLMLLVMNETYKLWRKKEKTEARKVFFLFCCGAALILIAFFVFYCCVGWDKFTMMFTYVSSINNIFSNLRNAQIPLDNATMINQFLNKTFGRYTLNVFDFYHGNGYFAIVTYTCLLLFFILLLIGKHNGAQPLSYSIYLLTFLLVGKLILSPVFFSRRIAPCYPLPFLLIAYTTGSLSLSIIKDGMAYLPNLKKKLIPLLFLGVALYACYSPRLYQQTFRLIFSPQCETMKDAYFIGTVLDKNSKTIFMDGCFSYMAIQLPYRFTYPLPDVSINNKWEQIEYNPYLVRRRLKEETDIKFVLDIPEAVSTKLIILNEFQGRLIASIRSFGFLYFIPRPLQIEKTIEKNLKK